ncbi:hypothetical protein OM788_006209 [Streptomyces sp. KA12]|uniref:hypothetical protein n=1 Tax=Streptomyces sp. KA12 TaxID=2991730 RepID=UPI0023B12D15|nr:hypothetical protein [Streptomyces sp. KA12]MDF0376234.1 hypothetical protein [Streptomyces sp. KA12]
MPRLLDGPYWDAVEEDVLAAGLGEKPLEQGLALGGAPVKWTSCSTEKPSA